MIPALLLAAATAAEPVWEGAWEPVLTRETVQHDGNAWLLFDADPDAWVRAICSTGPAPTRLALHMRAEAVTWVRSADADPLPLDDPDTRAPVWLFPPSTVHGRWWALDRPGCLLEQHRVHTQADRLDHLERDHRGPDALLNAATELYPEHPDLWPADDPWSAYLALRPAGGMHDVPVQARPPISARYLRSRQLPPELQRRWVGHARTPWTVHGPARVRLSARTLDPADQLCATLSGPTGERTACTWTEPLLRPQPQHGHLVAAPIPLDGRPAGKLHTWWAWVPAGKHSFTLDHDALVRLDVAALQLPARYDRPDEPTLLLRPDADTDDELVQAATLLDPSAPRTQLFGPAVRHPPGRDRTVWLPPEDLPPGLPWWEPPGRATIRVQRTDDQPCTLTLGGRAWRYDGPSAVHELWWNSDAPVDPAPPSMTGCALSVKVHADLPWQPSHQISITVTELPAARWVGVRWPHPPADEGRLWLLPRDTEPVQVRVLRDDGQQLHFTVQASPSERGTFTTPDGDLVRAPVVLPLLDPATVRALHTDRPVHVRLTASTRGEPLPSTLPAYQPPSTTPAPIAAHDHRAAEQIAEQAAADAPVAAHDHRAAERLAEQAAANAPIAPTDQTGTPTPAAASTSAHDPRAADHLAEQAAASAPTAPTDQTATPAASAHAPRAADRRAEQAAAEAPVAPSDPTATPVASASAHARRAGDRSAEPTDATPAPSDPTATPTPATPPPDPQAATWQEVTAATRALAAATTPAERAAALLRRAAAWTALDRPHEAWADLLLASPTLPDLDLDLPRWRHLTASAAAWAEHDGWTPLDPAWLPDDPAVPPRTLAAATEAAGRADHLTAAELLRPYRSPLRWWLAAAREQPLDDPQARLAFVDLHTHARDPDHPALAPIRRWSRWQASRGLRGVERTVVPWPRAPSEEADDAVNDALFPEPWPDDERLVLQVEGTPIEVPDTAQTVQLRCRPLQRVPPGAACRFRLRAATGELLQLWDVDPWGAASEVDLPAATAPRLLDLVAELAVHAELRHGPTWPDPSATSQRYVLTGPTATAELLGPTVLRLEALRPDGRPVAGTVQLPNQPALPLQATGPLWTAHLVVPDAGTQQVQLRLPPGTLLHALTRVPRAAPAEPAAHHRLLSRLYDPTPTAPIPGPAPAPPPAPAAPTTDPGVPLALTLGASMATGRDGDTDPEEPGAPVRRLSQQLSLSSRPTTAPLWLSARLQADEASDSLPVLRGALGSELWWTRAGWTAIALLDLDLRTAPATGLTRLGLNLRTGLGRRPSRWFDWRVELRADLTERAGLYDPAQPTPAWLWNPYRESHRLTGELTAQLRAYPNPWLRLAGWTSLRSNGPRDPQPVDGLGAGLDARLAQPGWSLGVEGAFWYRPKDQHRTTALLSPELRARALATLWTSRRLALQWWASARWLPTYGDATVEAGLRVLWSGRDGVKDLRASQVDVREAVGWGAVSKAPAEAR